MAAGAHRFPRDFPLVAAARGRGYVGSVDRPDPQETPKMTSHIGLPSGVGGAPTTGEDTAMIRRHLLAGIAGAGIAPVLFRPAAAQQPTSDKARNMLGDMAFALASSQLAAGKSENTLVKTFADLETEEQNAFTEARRMAGLPVPTTAMMDSKEQQMLQQLQSQRGAEFDRTYIQGQITGHRELLQLHQTLAQSGSGSRTEERMLATVAVPAIKSHLSMLQGIQRQLGG